MAPLESLLPSGMSNPTAHQTVDGTTSVSLGQNDAANTVDRESSDPAVQPCECRPKLKDCIFCNVTEANGFILVRHVRWGGFPAG